MIIGYTSGVFDMFHVGQLNLLKNAKGMCDKLFVGVNTDEAVMAYKNKKPFTPFEQRIEIIRSIRYVDAVFPRACLDEIQMHDILKFDLWFIGDDWFGSDMYNDYEKRITGRNVRIVYLPYTKGISATAIKNNLGNVKDNKDG